MCACALVVTHLLCRGFAFVYFETVEQAEEAKRAMDGQELDGRQVRLVRMRSSCEALHYALCR